MKKNRLCFPISLLFLSIISIGFQDLLILACSHPENRSILTQMEEWPEWILDILISNHEVTVSA